MDPTLMIWPLWRSWKSFRQLVGNRSISTCVTFYKQLCYIDQTDHVRSKHGIDLGFFDCTDSIDAEHKSSVVYWDKIRWNQMVSMWQTQDVDFTQTFGYLGPKILYRLSVWDIKSHCCDLATSCNAGLLVCSRGMFRCFPKRILSSSNQD